MMKKAVVETRKQASRICLLRAVAVEKNINIGILGATKIG